MISRIALPHLESCAALKVGQRSMLQFLHDERTHNTSLATSASARDHRRTANGTNSIAARHGHSSNHTKLQ